MNEPRPHGRAKHRENDSHDPDGGPDRDRSDRSSIPRVAGPLLIAMGLLVVSTGVTATVQVGDAAPVHEPPEAASGNEGTQACIETHQGPPPSVTIDPRDCVPRKIWDLLPDRSSLGAA